MKKIFVMLLVFGGLWSILQPIHASADDYTTVKDINGNSVITGRSYKMKVTFPDSSAVNYLYTRSNGNWIAGSTLESGGDRYRINDLGETSNSTPFFENQKVEVNNGAKWWNAVTPSLFYPNGGIDLGSSGEAFSFNPTSKPNQYTISYNNNAKIMGWSTTDMSFVTSTSATGYHTPQISFIP